MPYVLPQISYSPQLETMGRKVSKFGYFFGLLTLQVADACECGNEPSGSVKCGEFID